jgi:hypothetical protein
LFLETAVLSGLGAAWIRLNFMAGWFGAPSWLRDAPANLAIYFIILVGISFALVYRILSSVIRDVRYQRPTRE